MSDLPRELTAVLRHAIAYGITPGASVSASGPFGTLHVTVGRLASHNSEGHRLPHLPTDAPVSPTTRYDLASVTKTFATLAVISALAERHPLAALRTTPAHHYLPEFGTPRRSAITLRHLLTHTWGSHWEVPTWPEFAAQAAAGVPLPQVRAGFIERAITQPLLTDPGTHFEYACTSFHVLAAIAEKITGRRVADLVRERVLDPLGLPDIEYGPVPPENVAPAYLGPGEPDASLAVQRDREGYHSLNSANSGLFATATDLLRFGEALLAAESGPLSALLPLEYLRALRTPQVWVQRAADPQVGVTDDATATARVLWSGPDATGPARATFAHGLGFRIGDPGWFGGEPLAATWGHAGYSGTVLSANPDRGTVLALLTNRIHPSTLDPDARIAAGEPGVRDDTLAADLLPDGPRSIAQLRQRIGTLVHAGPSA
ncbi:beta-lactamase family protein [Micrococcales bacterium 31B]|nr:beta-lactamase family protein [Micrococcales bacterium 31B]